MVAYEYNVKSEQLAQWLAAPEANGDVSFLVKFFRDFELVGSQFHRNDSAAFADEHEKHVAFGGAMIEKIAERLNEGANKEQVIEKVTGALAQMAQDPESAKRAAVIAVNLQGRTGNDWVSIASSASGTQSFGPSLPPSFSTGQ